MKIFQLIVLVLIFIAPQITHAQLFGKLKKAVQDKVEQRIEDKIVEELSEELANRAMKPINQAFDQFLKSSYENETGEKWDQAKFDSVMTASGGAYMDFLEGMNKAANVPDQYTFDVVLEIETQEESKEKNRTEMMFSTSSSVMGFHQDFDDDDIMMVMDPDNDLMVMFNLKEKTAQAMPSMFTLTKGLASAYVKDSDYEVLSFEETGKTKKIAGYNSKEYKGETTDAKFNTYLSTELPFDWKDMYGGLIESISPKIYNENYRNLNGMMMKSENVDKKTNKKSKWEVKKVSTVSEKINKSDFKFTGLNS